MESELNAELKATIEPLRSAAQRMPDAAAQPARIELLPEQLTQQQLGEYHFQRRQLKAEIWVPIGKENLDLEVAHLSLSRETPHALLLGGVANESHKFLKKDFAGDAPGDA